ncbi:MAG: hypothetical protein LC778_19800 [Acidobacteria bacterium]|nr:hypothetical protein [Acidobacteriota bacterium]
MAKKKRVNGEAKQMGMPLPETEIQRLNDELVSSILKLKQLQDKRTPR